MKKPLALAALAAMILVGAAYPDLDKPDGDDAVHSERDDRGDHHGRDRHDAYADRDDRAAPRTYRACRSRNDDNCIQLHERGVRASYARWLRDGDPNHQPVRVARARYRGQHAAHHQRRGDHVRTVVRTQTRHHRQRVAHTRPHRASYVTTRTRCMPLARRPVQRTARAAPAPVRSAWPRAPQQQRRDVDSGVRGM